MFLATFHISLPLMCSCSNVLCVSTVLSVFITSRNVLNSKSIIKILINCKTKKQWRTLLRNSWTNNKIHAHTAVMGQRQFTDLGGISINGIYQLNTVLITSSGTERKQTSTLGKKTLPMGNLSSLPSQSPICCCRLPSPFGAAMGTGALVWQKYFNTCWIVLRSF